ncbi:MAG: hypothetical protein GC156_03830 [Actinomycetales bacterium]|nr:hypothetical protein [Actinomycetales bacterium]
MSESIAEAARPGPSPDSSSEEMITRSADVTAASSSRQAPGSPRRSRVGSAADVRVGAGVAPDSTMKSATAALWSGRPRMIG